MIKSFFVSLSIVVAAIVVVKAGAVSTARTIQALTPPILQECGSSIDPHAIMRNAPQNLPVESWNAI